MNLVHEGVAPIGQRVLGLGLCLPGRSGYRSSGALVFPPALAHPKAQPPGYHFILAQP